MDVAIGLTFLAAFKHVHKILEHGFPPDDAEFRPLQQCPILLGL